VIANAGCERPHIQLGAENNIEKSRCLAHFYKNTVPRGVREAVFSGVRVLRRPASAPRQQSFAVNSSM
jgi:hypothetical protein